jgi:hypothetical protein
LRRPITLLIPTGQHAEENAILAKMQRSERLDS